MLNTELKNKILDYFWDDLSGWDYDSWSSAGACDKEEMVQYVMTDLDIDPKLEEEVYDLFWTWADGIDRDSFEDEEDDYDEED